MAPLARIGKQRRDKSLEEAVREADSLKGISLREVPPLGYSVHLDDTSSPVGVLYTHVEELSDKVSERINDGPCLVIDHPDRLGYLTGRRLVRTLGMEGRSITRDDGEPYPLRLRDAAIRGLNSHARQYLPF